jgi:thymidylate kinase
MDFEKRGKFITLEGLSGVGKSTVATILAPQLTAVCLDTIPSHFTSVRHAICEHDSIDARFAFFLTAIVAAAQQINIALEQGTTVVCESYVHRTIAFHRGMGTILKIDVPPDLPKPDYIFYLSCEEPERQRRLAHRDKIATKWDRLAEASISQIVQEYARFQMITVDVTLLSPEYVVNAIAERVDANEHL